MLPNSIRLNIIYRRVEAEEAEEHRHNKHAIRRLLKRIQLQKTPLRLRLNPDLHQRHTDQARSQRNKPQHPCRPAEPNPRIQFAKDNRIDDASNRTPRRRKPVRERLLRRKVLRQQRDARHEQQPVADADAHGLAQHDLPVLGREARHHEAERDEGRAPRDQRLEVAPVEDRAGQHADEEQQERLDGADPGDLGGRAAGQQVRLVVGLEDAEGVDGAPGVEEEEEGAEDLEPGVEAAVGWGADVGGFLGGEWGERILWGKAGFGVEGVFDGGGVAGYGAQVVKLSLFVERTFLAALFRVVHLVFGSVLEPRLGSGRKFETQGNCQSSINCI